MGTDKARLELEGRSLLDHVLSTVRAVAGEVVLASGSEDRYADYGLPRVADEEPDAGPLAGILAGLEAIEGDRALVVACDMPGLDRGLLEALAERAEAEDLDVCWYESEAGLEPLCAVYSKRCAEPIRRSLARGSRKVRDFARGEELRIGFVRRQELGRRSALTSTLNLNTPEDLERERARRAEEREA